MHHNLHRHHSTHLAAFIERPKGVHFEIQERHEEVLYLLRRHFVTNLKWLTLGFLMLLVPVVFYVSNIFFFSSLGLNLPLQYQFVIVLVWYLITFGFLLESFLMWYFNVYIITNERLVDVDFFGLFYKQVSECQLNKIQDITHRVGGVFQIMFNYGHVLIQTAGTQDYFEFESIPEPDFVQKKILELIEADSDRLPAKGVLLDREA